MATKSASLGRHRSERHWNAVADGWATWLDWTERNFQPLTTWLCDLTAHRVHSRVLDVACGAGYPALAMARAVQRNGRVVATDLSQRMLALASERARSERLDNIEFVQMDAEALRFKDGSFDALTNTYGLMFCSEPLQALSEAYRVLARGARIAIATWDEPSKSPFFTVMRDAAARFFALPETRSDDPAPFRLASPDVLTSLLQAAGFSDIRVESFPMTFECETALEYCRILTDLAWKSQVAALPSSEAERFRQAVAAASRPYADGERIQLVATSLRAAGRK
jgi:ubiquinone/menaquinone biosynthesis C-methylase UbiE